MMDIEFSWQELLRLLLAFSFLVLMLALSRFRKLELERDILVAVTRMAVQLGLLGLVVFFVFSLQGAFIFLLLAAMVLGAAHISSQRTLVQLRARGFQVSFIAIGVTSLVVIGSALALGVMDWSADFIVPLGGMVIGNSMLRCGIAYERLASEFENNRAELESYLSLGASPDIAAEPLARSSLRAAIYPSLDNLKASGIVWIPGLMAGMILAGADPLWAAEVQVIIMLMLHSGAMLTAILATQLIIPDFFNQRQQLRF